MSNFKGWQTYALMLLSAGLGASMMYIAMRKKHRKEMNDMQEFYQDYCNKIQEASQAIMDSLHEQSQNETEEMNEEENAPVKEEPIDISEVVSRNPKEMIADSVYTIDPEQFGEWEDQGYTKERYTYYAASECFVDQETGVVENEDYIAEATDDMATDHFGDFEDDAAYFRNELTKTDIAIYLDPGAYEE